MEQLKKNMKVWSLDAPFYEDTGIYKIDKIDLDPDFGLQEETTVYLSNDEKSGVEAVAGDLHELKSWRKRMKNFFKQVKKIAKTVGWTVINTSDDLESLDLQFSKYTSRGQDFSFSVDCEDDDADALIYEIDEYYNDYDPEEEAALWLDENGHGKRGAPYHMKDVLADMEECESNLEELVMALKENLIWDEGKNVVEMAED